MSLLPACVSSSSKWCSTARGPPTRRCAKPSTTPSAPSAWNTPTPTTGPASCGWIRSIYLFLYSLYKETTNYLIIKRLKFINSISRFQISYYSFFYSRFWNWESSNPHKHKRFHQTFTSRNHDRHPKGLTMGSVKHLHCLSSIANDAHCRERRTAGDGYTIFLWVISISHSQSSALTLV